MRYLEIFGINVRFYGVFVDWIGKAHGNLPMGPNYVNCRPVWVTALLSEPSYLRNLDA